VSAVIPIPRTASAAEIFLRGAGEMATLTRAFDWSATPVGPVESWSASLRTAVSTLLASRHAMFLWWGPDLIQFYNDGYRPSLGPDRHPSALGARGKECWAEIWPIIGPEVEGIMAGGDATWHEDHLVPITRGDRVHDVYWSYSYSPVLDDDGSVGGVLVTVQETTRRVVSERRVGLLQDLSAGMLHARSAEDVCGAAMASFRAAPDDVGFALLYLGESDAGVLRLAGGTGLEPGSAAAPRELPVAAERPWPVARALARHGSSDPGQWSAPAEPIVCARWPEPVHSAATIPLAAGHSSQQVHGVLVLGLNPRLPLDSASVLFVAQAAQEIATALDGVQRVAMERALLAGIFELSPSFVAALRGPDHVYELVNPAYSQLIGHREALGSPVREVLPELEGQGWFELLDRVYATGQPFVGNQHLTQLQPTPGEPPEARYVNSVYQALRGPTGGVTGVLVSGVDVTALVEARQVVERALADTQRIAAERDAEGRRFRTMLEQAPLAVAIIGPAGEILFANPTFERLWGRPVEHTSAENYSEAYTGYHLDGRPIGSHEWAGARAVLRGEVVEGETIEIVQAPRAGEPGRRLTVWISAAPVRDAEGRITGGVVMFRDITAERKTEQQLRDAQRLQAVGTLAGGVAHEVNNALQGVLGFGSFVLRALGPEHPQSADMRLVLQSAERAARVSQQLLAYTRQQITQPQPVDLCALTADLRPVLQQLLGADKSLVLAFSGEVPKIQADPLQVEQVLINLVANARDATETGGRVTISVGRVQAGPSEESATADLGFRLPPGSYVRLVVADTGHGMSPETLERVFDPFFTTKPVGEGTGLGLSMVYGTVKQHGGYIGVRSRLGIGTAVESYWPPAAAPAAARAASDPASARAGGHRVVLVADDDELVRTLAVRTLEEEGYTVHAAEDGAAAVELFEREGVVPDLVVTDVIMPLHNGRQLHDAAVARWPGVPVLFISGHTGEEAVLQRLVPRGAPFLQKPFTPDALARTVAELLLSRLRGR
jgi:signal transduction histidine kinase/CheY-like chemotaxis protein